MRYPGQNESDVFHRLIPWKDLSDNDKINLENIEGWIRQEELNCK